MTAPTTDRDELPDELAPPAGFYADAIAKLTAGIQNGDHAVELTDQHLLALDTTPVGRQILAKFPELQNRVNLQLATDLDAYLEADTRSQDEARADVEAKLETLTHDQFDRYLESLAERLPRIQKIRATLRTPNVILRTLTRARQPKTRRIQSSTAQANAPPRKPRASKTGRPAGISDPQTGNATDAGETLREPASLSGRPSDSPSRPGARQRSSTARKPERLCGWDDQAAGADQCPNGRSSS